MRHAFAALAVLTLPAAAQEACGADPAAWLEENRAAMEGAWAAENTAMIMVSPATGTMDMGGQGALTFTLAAQEDGLLTTTQDPDAVPVLLRPDPRDVVIEPPEVLENQLDGDEIGVLLDCAVNDLPVLYGEAEAVVDGVAVRTELTALVAGLDRMLLWAHFQSPIGDIYMSYVADR